MATVTDNVQQETPLWRPSAARVAQARITDYMAWLARDGVTGCADYDSLWQWSVDYPDVFWRSIWTYFDLRSTTSPGPTLVQRDMPGAQWFPGARINYVDQVFRHADGGRPAIVFGDEAGEAGTLSWAELERQVASLAAALRGFGVLPGDRVAAFLPNRPEAVVAFLACAAVGAVWSVCSPDMGPVSVLDRFQQIQPKVLIACDGYRYGGKAYDRRDTVAEIRAALPSLEQVVMVPVLAADEVTPKPAGACTCGASAPSDVHRWRDVTASSVALEVSWLPFDHPLWIVYSSGTTGIPKAMVHGHGGIMLSMSVSLGFHNDLGPADRFHWYSTTGWIMWNCQVGALLLGSTICLFDGNPGFPDMGALWRFAGASACTFFGAGAAFYASCLKAGVAPREVADLRALRSIGSTGSPLSSDCYAWIYDQVGADVWLCPMSGGTDLAGPFVGGVPILPVYAGEMQCRVLGAPVQAFDEQGRAQIDQVGELVCTGPMPGMPLYFWNDADGKRYLDSYFDTYPGVWRHGDWLRITARGGAIIYGRSDATINRHGIRMGTSELYRAIESMPEILDSLVVDLEYLGQPSYMPLFVVLREGVTLDDALTKRINAGIRSALSARHVPNEVFALAQLPRTLTGKKLELPIKKLLMGQALASVVNPDALANPEALGWFVDFAARRAQDPAA